MGCYIQGIGLISPQDFFNKSSDWTIRVKKESRLTCIEPAYESWLDPKVLRRMSRLLKMGSASALCALQEANVEIPEAIITGTAYGCLEDTGIFLSKMIANEDGALNPTPFIQSTHNSIGSQIALLLKCHGYNLTISQRAFSFEHALVDALLLLDENEISNVLVGGADEITDFSYAILKRFGLTRGNKRIGEGTAYFLVSNEHTSNSYCILRGVRTIYKPKDINEVHAGLTDFLKENNVAKEDIDYVLSGDLESGYNEILNSAKTIQYKELCGEFPTSTSFALALGSYMLKNQSVPDDLHKGTNKRRESINRVLIHNSYFGIYYSMILLERV